jgi:LPS export ABC transporter protein LptC
MLFFMAFVIHFSCQSKPEPPRVDATYESDNYPIQKTWNAVVSFSDSGFVRAVLNAGYIAQYPRNGQLEKQIEGGLKVNFLNGKGEISSVLTSKKGLVYINNNMLAYDSVVVISTENTIITTDSLRWDASDKMIRSNSYVKIQKPTEIITGYGFESDQGLKNYRIFKVSGEVLVNETKESEKAKIE